MRMIPTPMGSPGWWKVPVEDEELGEV